TAVNRAALDYFLIAVALFITDYLSAVLFANSAERQMKALRQHALKHLLHLNISCNWFVYAAGLWYGGKKVYNNEATPGTVFQAFFGILLGSMSLGQISPNLSAVAEAKGSAEALFAILDTKSCIDASSGTGITPRSCAGAIQAVNIHFAYPSRPNAQILSNYSVKISPGQKVAFVGSSGGGKSTLVALLERFYDPARGALYLDGHDVKTLNVKWLRAQIGLVSQEPVLFSSSMFHNIAGAARSGNDTDAKEQYTREQVIAAAKLANAHDFIMSLPKQYETLVGEKGVLLSGGQKQRVTIARALLREPKILVLDEATSTLDTESERVVQAALNDLMKKTNMTTLVIAHRLSTTRNADKIVVVSSGCVVEEGSHDDLMVIPDGAYRNLYTIQQQESTKDDDADVGITAVESNESFTEEATEVSHFEHEPQLHRSSFLSVISNAVVDDSATEPTTESKFTIRSTMALSHPERSYFIAGMLGASLHGLSTPASALLISELLAVMNTKYEAFQETNERAALTYLKVNVTTYGICYVAGAVALIFIHGTQIYAFRFMAEKLTSRLRDIHFSSLLRQNIGFFDEPANATGALTAKLATDATKMSLVSGDSQGRLLQAASTFLAAVLISFTSGSWLLTFIMLVVLPFLVIGEVIRGKQMRGSSGLSDELEEVGSHASEALCDIRTVASLGLEDQLCDEFSVLLNKPLANGQREANINGLALGFSIGSAASWLGESDHAFKAGSTIFSLRDRIRPIDSFDESGATPKKLEGRLEFKDAAFKYSTRPNVTVFKHYNLVIEAGQTVAFCGPSGGGKSTIISLIERFYDPVHGQVLLDGVDTKTLNVAWLRRQIGLVGQEPALFIGTIEDNITYGLEQKPSQQQIEDAAKMANAHDFIAQFPDGYDTLVGMKDKQLSGGQKQRVAIARAILRNPTILLLDEANSAMDSESEKAVQAALDKVVALQRRTTIIVAHRLSTIRHVNKICVVNGGRITEEGTHEELVRRNGIYTQLVNPK
uniref:Uncharacterized protein n=1 Tax=Globisporangium ultimum (strain ATCC 200006 / CBS 805.95 / DAOM BR144) TaxID=431595 RepID=K3WT79_GLOUD